MIKCPNCGGVLKHDASKNIVKCEHCGSEFKADQKIAPTKKAGETNQLNGKVYSCSQCGANLMTFDETAITFCSYCGSQAMIESKMMVQTNPDYVIPFSKTKEECIKKYKEKVNKSIFVPNYMKSDIVVDKFRGIYIPYCIYKLGFKGVDKEKGSKYSHRSGDYQYYNDYSLEFNVDANYEGFSYDLSSKFYDRYSEAIPFNEEEKIPFSPNYMLGYYADAKDVDANLYLDSAKNEAHEDYSKRITSTSEAVKYGCKGAHVNFDQVEQKIAMFPLYFLAIRSKNDKRVSYAIVNGQTGELVTELPVSYTKYIIGSIIVSAIVFLLINNFLVLTPHKVCFVAIVFAVLGLIIGFVQSHTLADREKHNDDIGLKSVKQEESSLKIFSALSIVLAVLAMLIPVVILALKPVDDIFYYEAAIVSLGLVLFNFYSIIKKHNELVSTKLPQLEKRGGDESA